MTATLNAMAATCSVQDSYHARSNCSLTYSEKTDKELCKYSKGLRCYTEVKCGNVEVKEYNNQQFVHVPKDLVCTP